MTLETKKTVLYESHQQLRGRLIEFGGWRMPVFYTSVLDEHRSVREHCGVFDVSHMGQVFIEGPEAKDFLQLMTMNDVSRLEPGKSQYSGLLNPRGGFIDDIIVYQLSGQRYLLCVNAANIEKDVTWLLENAARFKHLKIENLSDNWSQIAVQGPESSKVLERIFPTQSFRSLKYTEITDGSLGEGKLLIARTGYTGEKGYEIYLPNQDALALWNLILEGGAKPIGLGARDTLRLEAGYLLYGNEMNDEVSPLEAGVQWAVKFDCGEFIGKDALMAQKNSAGGVPRKLVAFKFADGGIPRHGMSIFKSEEKIGEVTSGSVLPTVGGSGGLALVSTQYAEPGTEIHVDVRGQRKLAKVYQRPLYPAHTKDL